MLTVPLLVGTDGVEKMGKSLNNYIAISEPPAEQFGKVMSIPDKVVTVYATLCTTIHPREVAALEADISAGGKRANEAKRGVARAIVALYHGDQAAAEAEERFNSVFRDHAVPTDAPEFGWDLTGIVHLPALMTAADLADSGSAARRLVDAGAVKIDGVAVPGRQYDLEGSELDGRVLAVGKRKVARVTNLKN